MLSITAAKARVKPSRGVQVPPGLRCTEIRSRACAFRGSRLSRASGNSSPRPTVFHAVCSSCRGDCWGHSSQTERRQVDGIGAGAALGYEQGAGRTKRGQAKRAFTMQHSRCPRRGAHTRARQSFAAWRCRASGAIDLVVAREVADAYCVLLQRASGSVGRRLAFVQAP